MEVSTDFKTPLDLTRCSKEVAKQFIEYVRTNTPPWKKRWSKKELSIHLRWGAKYDL